MIGIAAAQAACMARLFRCSVLAALATSCGGGAPHDLQVMSYTPTGSIEKIAPIEIKFDRPVVAPHQIGMALDASAAAATAKITPAHGPPIAWKGFWKD